MWHSETRLICVCPSVLGGRATLGRHTHSLTIKGTQQADTATCPSRKFEAESIQSLLYAKKNGRLPRPTSLLPCPPCPVSTSSAIPFTSHILFVSPYLLSRATPVLSDTCLLPPRSKQSSNEDSSRQNNFTVSPRVGFDLAPGPTLRQQSYDKYDSSIRGQQREKRAPGRCDMLSDF